MGNFSVAALFCDKAIVDRMMLSNKAKDRNFRDVVIKPSDRDLSPKLIGLGVRSGFYGNLPQIVPPGCPSTPESNAGEVTLSWAGLRNSLRLS